MGRVSKGKGLGKDFHTLAEPLPLGGVKGIYKDKKIPYIYEKYMAFPSEIFIFRLHEGILHRIRVILTFFIVQIN